MKLPPLIGIAGRARTGKDTTVDFLIAQYGGYRYSFADPLRAMLKVGLGIDMDDTYWKMNKENTIPALGCSPRQLLQTLGTEWGRQQVHPDVWLIMASDMLHRRGRGMVISDIRFENEAAWVRKHDGVVIHQERDAAPAIREHASEVPLIIEPADTRLYNNAGLMELQFAVSRLFHE